MLDVGGEPEFPASEVDNFVKATVAAATRGDITKSEAWQLKEKAKCVHYQQVSGGLGVSTCSWVLGDRPHLNPLDMVEIGVGAGKLLAGAVKVATGGGFLDTLQRVKPKSQRKRWVDSKGHIYEWDSLHGELEKYTKRGQHLGAYDPETGRQIKPAQKGRLIEP